MSLIPELVLQKMLVQGLNAIRQDRKLLDTMFRNVQQDDLDSIWKYVRDNVFDIAINYPDDPPKLPAIIILLRSEFESENFLGDMMQAPEVQESGPFRTGPTAGSVTPVTQTGPKILQSDTPATGGTATTITTDPSYMPLYDPFEEAAWVNVIGGTGVGQRRRLVSVAPITGSDSVLTVTPVWDTVPDSSSVFRIEGQGYVTVGEPSKVFKATDVVIREGAHYQTSYQLMIMAQAPELVIYLYMITKALFFLSARFLISQGFLNIKLSGTDYLPNQQYLPDRAYQRSLMVEFNYSFDVFHTPETVDGQPEWVKFNEIKSYIGVHDPDVTDPNDPERVVIETELDL